jgi:hypothetical protein
MEEKFNPASGTLPMTDAGVLREFEEMYPGETMNMEIVVESLIHFIAVSPASWGNAIFDLVMGRVRDGHFTDKAWMRLTRLKTETELPISSN